MLVQEPSASEPRPTTPPRRRSTGVLVLLVFALRVFSRLEGNLAEEL